MNRSINKHGIKCHFSAIAEEYSKWYKDKEYVSNKNSMHIPENIKKN